MKHLPLPVIRNASHEDISVIQLITYQSWPDAYKNIIPAAQIIYMMDLIYSTEALERQMTKEHQQFVLVYECVNPVAFAAFSEIEKNIYKLHKLYALPNQQGKGLGKMLINHIIEEIKKLGAKALRLNVNRFNKAKNFYEHLGFTVIKEEDIDIGEGYFMNDYVMEKKL
jgi:GNAT superfamily N-acetyltransferase